MRQKDAMMSRCLHRKESHLASAQYWTGLAGGDTGRLAGRSAPACEIRGGPVARAPPLS